MPLDQLIERMRVPFPRSLSMDEVKELLHYIKDNSDYNVVFEEKMLHWGIDRNPERSSREIMMEEYCSPILKGHIFSRKDDGIQEFGTDFDINKPDDYVALKFEQKPGYSSEDYNPDTHNLWKNIRTMVSEYFANEQSSSLRD